MGVCRARHTFRHGGLEVRASAGKLRFIEETCPNEKRSGSQPQAIFSGGRNLGGGSLDGGNHGRPNKQEGADRSGRWWFRRALPVASPPELQGGGGLRHPAGPVADAFRGIPLR